MCAGTKGPNYAQHSLLHFHYHHIRFQGTDLAVMQRPLTMGYQVSLSPKTNIADTKSTYDEEENENQAQRWGDWLLLPYPSSDVMHSE